MQVSWTWLNKIVNTNRFNINDIIDKMILAGFEVDSIHNINTTNDQIIDISITPNRLDTSSIMGLSREINTILGQQPYKQFIYNNLYTKQYQNIIIDHSKSLKYINFTFINRIYNNKSPKYIQNYLVSYNIQPSNLILDVHKYIKLKWNYEIYITTLDKIYDTSQFVLKVNYLYRQNTDQKNLTIYTNNKKLNQNNLIIYSFIKKDTHISSTYEDFNKAYNETINIIQTYGKAIIGKFYQYCNTSDINNHQILITKDKINNILGPIGYKYKQYLSTKTILQILKQLNFNPSYHRKNKSFQVVIPEHRINDIQRDIDIIEEISRIYGFHQFYDNINYLDTYKKGKIEDFSAQVFHIRQILRSLGLHETLSSSFLNNIELNKKTKDNEYTTIYNPMNEYNKILRNNIIDNLIQHYIYNQKQNTTQCEFFEIGKVFHNKPNSCEHINLAGLLANNHFARISWSTKPLPITWFHAKGLLEEFFSKMNCLIEWQTYNSLTNKNFIVDQIHAFNIQRSAFMYNPMTNKPIGIFGEINNKTFRNFAIENKINSKIYAFEINLNQLIKAINYKDKTEYLMHSYSTYPKITRDIVCTLNENTNIHNIIMNIKKINQDIIEVVDIFNEYYNSIKKIRSVGLRIIYRSKYKTLQVEEIENTHRQIQQLLQNVKESKS